MEKTDGVFIKIFVDDLERYQKLSDAEYGSLVRAGLAYRATSAEPILSDKVALLWDVMKLDIDRDVKRYEKLRHDRSEAGKSGAIKKWQTMANDGKAKQTMAKRNKTIDKDIDKDIDIDKDKDNSNSLLDSGGCDENLNEAIKEFIDFRKKIKKPMTERAISMLKKRLEKLAPGNDELKVQMLQKSIYMGWHDVYEIDRDKSKTAVSVPATNNPFLKIYMEEEGGMK